MKSEPILPLDIRALANEESLKKCSSDAFRLWIFMLLYMAWNTKAYGYLPAYVTPEKLCEKASVEHSSYEKLLAELEERKVFSRTAEAGTIYCRRMVREAGKGNTARGGLHKVLEDLMDQYPPERVTMRSSIRAEFWRLVEEGIITAANAAEILPGLDRWKVSVDWHKEKGQYIPGLLKWLSDERWKARPKPSPIHAPPTEGNGRDPFGLFVPPKD